LGPDLFYCTRLFENHASYESRHNKPYLVFARYNKLRGKEAKINLKKPRLNKQTKVINVGNIDK